MTDSLQLPSNWRRWTDDELRSFIETTSEALRRCGSKRGQEYFARLYRARLAVLRSELDRRIQRQAH